jgi:hypothetical protein
MLRITHCLDNRLIDGGKVVSTTHRPRSTPQKRYFSASDTHFTYSFSTSVSRLSRQCGILNISQSYRPPRPVMEMACLLDMHNNHCILKTDDLCCLARAGALLKASSCGGVISLVRELGTQWKSCCVAIQYESYVRYM